MENIICFNKRYEKLLAHIYDEQERKRYRKLNRINIWKI